jgi:trimeric autotransporter adhesin
VHQTWVIVSERAKGKGKSANRKLIASALLVATHVAMAAPTDGQVTAGSGSVSQSGTTTTVTQSSQNLSLSWSSFNTTSNETVTFIQPSTSSIAVNRISDTSATQFYGQLNANGQVYLINPNGILFGAGSQINVGGLVASTLDISDASLTSATRNFSGTGSGSIINQGTINAANGSYVAFIGNTVSNQGTINAPSGAVALGAGSDVTLSFSSDSLVKLQINQSTLDNLAENGSLIKADGGAVWLSAGAKDAVLASVVNNTGIIQARSVQNVDGTIVLEAGSAGTASNSGTLDASGVSTGETGGTVKVLGGTVNLLATSAIDVSGDAGGGTALIGGNFHGTGTEQNAKTTTVDAGATINADAITTGNGGNVAVWSDGTTQFNGSITARGGSTSGNGGQVETSGKVLNINASASVNTASPHGTAGDWLLDPDDITIGDTNIWVNSYGINVDTTVLTNALNNGNVTIKTTGSSASCMGTTCTGTSGNGDIIVLDTIGGTLWGTNWTSNSTLTLSAYRDIHFKYVSGNTYGTGGAIVSSSGGAGNVVLRADNSATGTGTVTFDDLNYNFVILTDGASTTSIYYNPTSYNSPTNYGNYVYGTYNAYMAINVTGSAASKIYDGNTTATVSGLTSLLSMPSGLTLDTSSAVGIFADKNAGTDKTVSIIGVTATGNGATTGTNSDGATVVSYGSNNYYINGLDSKTATITAKTISASGVTANDKTYDGTITATLSGTASVASGVVQGDSISVSSGTATFDNANAGVSKDVTVTGLTLSGTDAGNYILTQPTGLTATINKADLTLTGTKTYDGTTTVAGSTLTASGVAGETFTVSGSGDATNLASKNVQSGTTLGSITGLSLGSSSNGGLSSNYNVLGTSGSSYTVTAKGITLTGITAADKTYDATTSATLNTANVSYSGLINGDDVSLGGSGSGSFATKDVGTNKAVTVSGYSLSGADAGNYVVAQPTGLTATISKADLVVSGVSGVNKTYDATTTATLTGGASVSALQSDVVSVVGTGNGSFADANAGTNKTVTVTGYTLSGTDAGNYNVVQPTSVTATINKADLSLSGSKVYDGTTSVAGNTLTATGVAGQTFTITGTGDASNLVSKNVQTGTTLGSTTGLNLGTSSNGGLTSNYNVLGTSGSSYTVTAKGITLTGITAADKVYDATTTATLNTGNVAYAGMINGDDVSLGGSGSGSFATKDVGTNKTVTVSGYTLSGADAGNYVVAQPTGLTATITKADLSLTGLSTTNKVYDTTTTATLSGTASLSAAIGSDSVSLTGTGTGNFTDKNVGTHKSVTVSGYTLTGTDAGNYNIVDQNALTANITPASMMVSGITAADKVYDGTTAATVSTSNATLAGRLGSDVITIASTGLFSDAAVGDGKTVNLSSTYGGADAGNYIITGQSLAFANITAAPVVVTSTPVQNTPTQQIQNTVTQVQSTVLPPQASAQPQVLNLSSTLVVQQQTDSGSSSTSTSSSSSNSQATGTVVNTTTGFGTPAPMLQIQNGGLQLPLVLASITE